VVLHSRFQKIHLLGRNVRRIGDDRVEWALRFEGRQPVTKAKIDAFEDPKRRRIAPCDGQCSFANVDCHKMSFWLLMCTRNRQTARTGSYINAAGRPKLASDRQIFCDDELGFGARNQHVGRDVECKREKLLSANKISHWRPLRPTNNQISKSLARRLSDFVVE